MKKDYKKLLKNAPDHDSPEFIEYLRENNPVVWEHGNWIVIKNFKYDWLTAFSKMPNNKWWKLISPLWKEFGHLEWLKKSDKDQTVKRFHIHLK